MTLHVPRRIIVFCAFVVSLSTYAQPTGLSYEVVHRHEGMVGDTDLTGYTTYRIYVDFTSESDFLSSLYGSTRDSIAPFTYSPDDEDIVLEADCGCFHSEFGALFANGFSMKIVAAVPELAYHSFYTINKMGSNEPGQLSYIASTLSQLEEDATSICNWRIDDGSIFTYAGEPNGYARESKRVLIAQVTSCSEELRLSVCVQTFVGGNQDDVHYWCTEEAFVIRP